MVIHLCVGFIALAVGLGSFGLYMVPFFFPEVYRKYDLIWSGVGTAYAIVLWLCMDQITILFLLSQLAIVFLLGRFVWQNLELRRAITPNNEKTAFPDAGVTIAAVIQFKTRQLIRYLSQADA
ncbi:MAG: Ycf66 family protein [Cyanobacteria bacterium P01_F01_bin.150]